MKTKLLFVDTNIWLDFYRSRTDAGLALLHHLEALQDKLIVTYQLEMEFKKHRQEAILETVNLLKPPTQVSRPALFSDAKAVNALHKNIKAAEKRVATLKARLKQVLLTPSSHDPVYQVCQRIFHKTDDLLLTRTMMREKAVVKRKAMRRFLLGCPPRKRNDTSMGDAVNWEWVVHCAHAKKADVVVVSRDTDYGITYDGKSYINDHLAQEFKDRTSRKRKIVLYDRLSQALKEFTVAVTPEEESEEKAMMTAIESLDYEAIMKELTELVSIVKKQEPPMIPEQTKPTKQP